MASHGKYAVLNQIVKLTCKKIYLSKKYVNKKNGIQKFKIDL